MLLFCMHFRHSFGCAKYILSLSGLCKSYDYVVFHCSRTKTTVCLEVADCAEEDATTFYISMHTDGCMQQ